MENTDIISKPEETAADNENESGNQVFVPVKYNKEIRNLELDKAAELAQKGLKFEAIADDYESLKRIANRVQKGGHDIPPEDVTRRFNTRFHDIAEVLPYCDEAVFYDN